MPISPHQKKKEERIQERFQEWSAQKENGKQIYSYEYIVSKLSEEFYLSERTIEAILRGEYEQRRQKARDAKFENQGSLFTS